MTYVGDESRSGKDSFHEKSTTNRRRSIVWILVALGFLIVGLAGGTVMFAWKKEWTWVFPMAGFCGYLLAFRRGMSLWNPAVDRTWRRHLWLERVVMAEDEEVLSVAGEHREETLRILGQGTRPQRHVLRLVR